MYKHQLIAEIKSKKSFLCVGLDTDVNKLPVHLPKTTGGILAFNQAIIDATKHYAVCYKINTAFYEALGSIGWEIMQETFQLIPANCLSIADAKRGDIGNTAQQYAIAFFEKLQADAITVSPYMGFDSINPFLDYSNKWTIVLGLTSNAGHRDIQMIPTNKNRPVWEKLVEKLAHNYADKQLMFVAGATSPEKIKTMRSLAPDHFFLVPGVGAQGGTVEEVASAGINADIGLLINSSRGIIYASNGEDFAEKAGEKARELQQKMKKFV